VRRLKRKGGGGGAHFVVVLWTLKAEHSEVHQKTY
jgi:hypothetical protein